jgi:hypothetical protein
MGLTDQLFALGVRFRHWRICEFPRADQFGEHAKIEIFTEPIQGRRDCQGHHRCYADESSAAAVAREFKIFYGAQPAAAQGHYAVNHSSGVYVYDLAAACACSWAGQSRLHHGDRSRAAAQGVTGCSTTFPSTTKDRHAS